MRYWHFILLLFALAAGASPALSADRDIRVEVRDYGTYEAEIVGRYEAPRTVAGVGHTVTGIRLIEETDTVFAQPGVSFGLRYQIHGEPGPEDHLVSRTVHPPLTNPATGETRSISETDISPFADFSDMYDAYAFDHRWEMAEGVWRFQIVLNGEVIHEQRFRVVIPLN